MKKILILGIFSLLGPWTMGQTLYFPPTTGNQWDTLSPAELGYCPHRIDSLYQYLDTNNTKAFILLQDGKIVLEKYFGNHTQNSMWQWASAGKTITAFLIGVAQDQQVLNIGEPASKYLGQGWTSCTAEQEQKITVRQQLSMSSGLDDGVPSNDCTLDTCLVYKADAGTRWAYHNAPYTLLTDILEKATGQDINGYATQYLKEPTGMNGGYVSIGYNKVYFSNARSMARFGLLILNQGNWAGTPILIDSQYFNQMTSTSQEHNLSYGYFWWLNGKSSIMVPGYQTVFPGPMSPHAPADMMAGMGKDGQFLNVVPSRNMVWIRMGLSPGSTAVPFLMNDAIWAHLNALNCTTTDVAPSAAEKDFSVLSYPNPNQGNLTLDASEKIKFVEVHNHQGQVVIKKNVHNSRIQLDISNFKPGIYSIMTWSENGSTAMVRLLKQ